MVASCAVFSLRGGKCSPLEMIIWIIKLFYYNNNRNNAHPCVKSADITHVFVKCSRCLQQKRNGREEVFQASNPWNLDDVFQRLSWDVMRAMGFSVLPKSDCSC